MRWEFDRLNAGLVAHPCSVQALLEDPTALKAKDGDPYSIDGAVLKRLAACCTEDERVRLRLPITVYFPADVVDSAYVIDALAAEILHRLEGWGPAYPYRDGKMWIPQSVAVDLLLRFGGALQRLLL